MSAVFSYKINTRWKITREGVAWWIVQAAITQYKIVYKNGVQLSFVKPKPT